MLNDTQIILPRRVTNKKTHLLINVVFYLPQFTSLIPLKPSVRDNTIYVLT